MNLWIAKRSGYRHCFENSWAAKTAVGRDHCSPPFPIDGSVDTKKSMADEPRGAYCKGGHTVG